MYDNDRRRLALALLLTVLAVPAFFLYRRSVNDGAQGDSAAVTVTAASDGNVINPLPGEAAEPEPEGDDDGTANSRSQLPDPEAPDDGPVFMDGPSVDTDDGPTQIAVPAAPAVTPLLLSATYASDIAGVRTCLVRDVPSGITVRVTNVDNGRSIECVTASATADQIEPVVIHTESFENLADLTEAPISVELLQ